MLHKDLPYDMQFFCVKKNINKVIGMIEKEKDRDRERKISDLYLETKELLKEKEIF